MQTSPRPLIAVLLAVILAMAACGSGAAAEGDGSASGSDTASGTGSASVSVEHAMGTTEVDCTPERVVTLGQGQTDSTLALGVTPVGVVKPWTLSLIHISEPTRRTPISYAVFCL